MRMSLSKDAWVVHLCLTVTAIFHSFNYSVVKIVSPHYIGAFGLIVTRVVIAGGLFWLASIWWGQQEKIKRNDLFRLILCALFGTSANILLFFKGVSMSTPTNAALIMTITPVLVFILTLVLTKEKLRFKNGVGVLIAFAGTIWLFKSSFDQIDLSQFYGNMLVFINALFYGIYVVIVKPLSQRYQPITIFKWLFLLGLLFTLPFGYHELVLVDWSALPLGVLFAVLFIGIGATFLTYLLNVYALKRTSPTVVGVYIYLQPLMASVIGIILGMDEFHWLNLLIAIVIIFGVYLVSSASSRTNYSGKNLT